jgi:signal transduction histidine kinase
MSGATVRSPVLAFILTFALLILNGVLSYHNTLAVADRERRVAQTQETLDVLHSILSTLAHAEAGQRGYLITGQPRYLQPYHDGRAETETEFERLQALTVGSSRIQQRLPTLKQLILSRFHTMEQAIAVRDSEGFEAAQRLVGTDQGEAQVDAIRQIIAAMKEVEDDHLQHRAARSHATTQMALGVVSATTALGVAFVGLCFYLVHRDSRRRQEVESELRQANQNLELADQRKNEFLAILAHELRNPLASLLTALHLQRAAGSSVIQQTNSLMERQVRNMSRFIDDLLDVSRISQGKLQLRKELLDLVSAVAGGVEIVRPFLAERRQQLIVSLPHEPVWVQADPARIAQIVTNLLTNAAKYTDEAGQVWLTVQRRRSEAILSVRDTGVGIPAEMLPKVFDLFMQAERTLDHAHGGLGIGLNLVRRLVELHDGRVEARSGGVGKGSEFIVHLPALPEKGVGEPSNGYHDSRPLRFT